MFEGHCAVVRQFLHSRPGFEEIITFPRPGTRKRYPGIFSVLTYRGGVE